MENELNAARIKAGLSIKALAEFLDAPYSTIQDSCSGKHKMPRWVEKLILEKLQNSPRKDICAALSDSSSATYRVAYPAAGN